jgi:hypothetical protein
MWADMMQRARWPRLFLRWAKVLIGQSYYHQPQRLGKGFRPEELAGYFNDLTAKTHWTGYTDEEGIPVNILADGRRVYFATTVVQKALGHWDKWLLTRNDEDKEEFLRLCRWLLVRQDNNGGWPVWSELGLSVASPYSAMTQGECISAFVRAWKLTGEEAFAEGARQALDLMCRPLENGGPAIIEGKNLFLEELPTIPRSSILNGWIFALFGLYDFLLAFKDKNAYNLFKLSFDTLKNHLREYDTGYWSYYDARGHLASFFYHDLHIHQLTALALLDNDSLFVEFRDRWIRYQQSWKNRVRALGIKVTQKLREPGEAVIVR